MPTEGGRDFLCGGLDIDLAAIVVMLHVALHDHMHICHSIIQCRLQHVQGSITQQRSSESHLQFA